MLRNALIVIGVLLLLVGVICALAGLGPLSLFFLINGVVLTIGIIYERWRYKSIVHKPDAAWQATGERFVDPETGRLTAVYYDPATGKRHYVDSQTRARSSGG